MNFLDPLLLAHFFGPVFDIFPKIISENCIYGFGSRGRTKCARWRLVQGRTQNTAPKNVLARRGFCPRSEGSKRGFFFDRFCDSSGYTQNGRSILDISGVIWFPFGEVFVLVRRDQKGDPFLTDFAVLLGRPKMGAQFWTSPG